MAIVLIEAHAGRDLRQEHRQHVRPVQQHRQHVTAAQQFIHLCQDTLRRDTAQQRRLHPQRRIGPRLDRKSQYGGKAQRPQDTQRILLKASFRLSHTPQDTRLQILPPAIQIGDMPAQVHRHGVHRQVTAAEILLQPVGEKHLIRPAMVRIGPIRPEGGHFNVHLPRPDRDRPVLQPGWDGIAVKQCKHLLRPRGGGHVPISRCAAQQRVPHAAAHGIGGEARILQPFQHILHRLRQHGFASPHVFSSSAAKYRQKSRLHGRKRCIIIVQ